MSGSFHLYLLGRPRLIAPSGDEIRLRVRKHMGLLAWLAMAGPGPARREFLAELLWPGVDVPRARQSLAQALSVLRARLEPGSIACDRDTIALVPGFLELDVRRLEAGDILGDEYMAPLEVDGFLTGFEIPDAREFEHWAEAQRARLLPGITAGLLTLMDHARRTGDMRALERCAERLLAMDDLSEHGVHGRMEAWAMAGDRVSALRLFDRWSERLASELGAGPPAQLEALATRLRRRGWERPLAGGKAPPAVRTEQWQDRPFVGRAAEYRMLYDHWEEVRAGRAACVLVTGESGVGKTMLVDRFSTAAALEGATLSRVRCFEVERQVPFAAIGGLLGRLCDRPGAAATSPASLAVLATVVPEVSRRWSALPPVPDLRGEAARVRFADAAAELLGALADEHPVILVLDDVHIADEVSLAVLHLVIRQLPDRAVMVVMISRQGAAGGDGARALRESAAGAGFDQVALEPMQPGEAEELLDRLLESVDRRPGLTERRILLNAAGGYPLALDLLVRDWVERGPGCLALSLGAMTPDVPGVTGEAYRRLAVSLYDRLEPSSRMVLHLAALLDRRLNELSMYSLVDISVAQAMYGLATLTFNGTLRDTGTGLEFLSPTLRANAYLGIPSSLRRILHHAVAGVLLEREAGGEWIPGLELAWHCIRGGRESEMPRHLLRGAREAINSGAAHEAEIALRSGSESLKHDDKCMADLLLCESLQETSRWEASLAVLESTREGPSTYSARGELFRILATRHLAPRAAALLRSLGTSVLKQFSHKGECPSPGLATLVAASTAGYLADPAISKQVDELTGSLPVHGLNIDEFIRYHIGRAMISYQRGDTARSMETLSTTIAAVERSGIASGLLPSLFIGRGVNRCADGEYSVAVDDFTAAHREAVRLGNGHLQSVAAANLTLTHVRLGHYAEALHWAATARYHPITEPELAIQVWYYHSLASAHLSGTDILPQPTVSPEWPDWLRQRYWLYRADLALLIGRKQSARESALKAFDEDRGAPLHPRHAGAYWRWRVQVAATANDLTRIDGAIVANHDTAGLDALDRLELGLVRQRVQEMLSRVGQVRTTTPTLTIASLPPAAKLQVQRLVWGDAIKA